MSKTVYDYMNWAGIEAIVYGEETAPRDVMGPRLTPDGVLIQGFFPEARAAAVVTGRKKYEMEFRDGESLNTNFRYRQVIKREALRMPMALAESSQRRMRLPSCAAFIMKAIRS